MINRILLIDIDLPNDRKRKNTVTLSHHPVGLMYLASAVRESFPDIDIRIFHTVTNDNPVLSIEELISEFNPDIIGLRSLSIAKQQFKQTAERIREIVPDRCLIAGGPYPSSSCHDILLSKMVDIVVIGKGETTLVELIDHLQKDRKLPLSLPGTAVLENDKLRVNAPRPPIQDIDSISFPDYNLVDLRKYRGITNHANLDSSQSAFICSSRGCPYECFYCHQLFGKKIRRRSPYNLIDEMREHVERRGISNFVFLDDVFNVPMKTAKETLTRIAKELTGIGVSFPNGLRADQLDEEMIDLFEKAGTVELALAVETATPRRQALIGKRLNLERAKEAIESASRRFIVRFFYDWLSDGDL
jgi:anaerobic magnesium-protoporphyrin IX monomethyl ester cyclase